MTTAISNKALLEKCGEFIKADPTTESLDQLIKDALITANREINNCDSLPLAWLRQSYNELFTRTYAEISAITQANPGVITAESMDDDISNDHGFYDDDIIYIAGIDGMDELNYRLFRATRASATTLTLKQLDNQIAIDTSSYDEYSSGGYIYHCGIVIPHSTIQPSNSWEIKRVFDVTFDLKPAHIISEEAVNSDLVWLTPSGRPQRWRYLRYYYTDMTSPTHFLLFYPPTQNRYNIGITFEITYPDLSTWNDSTYPPHPPEVHDYIWHRALANLATNAERQRREIREGNRPVMMGQIEVLYAQHWQGKKIEDEIAIKNLSRSMLGSQPTTRGWSA
jgi:hypothetical protein